MRYLFFMLVIVLTGCHGFDYNLDVACEDVTLASGDLLLCHNEVQRFDADEYCFSQGGDLLRQPNGYEDQEAIAAIGNLAFDGVSWHVGWPDYYDCPLMSWTGASGDDYDCNRVAPFICSFE